MTRLQARRVVGAKTKIVVTIGPATESPEMIQALLQAGVDVFRLNFSHGDHPRHATVLGHIRSSAERLQQPVAIMQDLGGPKIRVGPLPEAGVRWEPGQTVRLRRETAEPPDITCTYPHLVDDVEPGQRVLLADGTIVLRVESKTPEAAVCRVEVGGIVFSRKGINLPDTQVSSPALTDKDLEDLAWGIRHGVDYVALSFVRRADDVRQLRRLLDAAGCPAHVVAKIEKPEALGQIDAIIEAADALMVARGDLGVEIDPVRVPFVQKDLIRRCHAAQRPVITATQMLESMIERPMPTRAEVSDVANAILDGTDAVMLSGETAVGRYPLQAVRVIEQVALQTEERLAGQPLRREPSGVDAVRQALCHGAVCIAEELKAALVLVASRQGRTARVLSKQRSFVPTVSVSDSPEAIRRMCLYWGVVPLFATELHDPPALLARVVAWAREHGMVRPDDHVVFLTTSQWADTGEEAILVHRVTGP